MVFKSTRMIHPKRIAQYILPTLLALGCAGNPRSGPQGHPNMDTVQVEVENQNFYDATIRYRYGTTAPLQRLGAVTGNQTEQFAIDWSPRPLQLTIDFVGAGSATTDDITTSAGDVVVLTLPPNAHRNYQLQIRR